MRADENAPGRSESTSGGFAEPHSASYIVDFLSTSEGLQLNRAFSRIGDAKVRRRIVDLVRSIAGDGEDS